MAIKKRHVVTNEFVRLTWFVNVRYYFICTFFDRDSEDEGFAATREFLSALNLLQICSEEDVKIVWYTYQLLLKRAADIVASSLATIVRRLKQPNVSIAFDGSFYRRQPQLGRYIQSKINELCPSNKVSLFIVHDGSGRGGALAAATMDGA